MKKIKAIYYLPFFLLLYILAGCAMGNSPQRAELKLLQKGKIEDDSSFVYQLPYEAGKSHLLVQGYYSRYTHKNRAALDFKMSKGTKICAVRDGVVVRIKKDGSRGGSNAKYRADGNYIVIQHEDSTRSGYWHLKHDSIFVEVGEIVKQGQVIGLSGRTGYSYFPHLHFIVWRYDKNNKWTQVGTRFQTQKGIRYLRPFRFYINTTPTK